MLTHDKHKQNETEKQLELTLHMEEINPGSWGFNKEKKQREVCERSLHAGRKTPS